MLVFVVGIRFWSRWRKKLGFVEGRKEWLCFVGRFISHESTRESSVFTHWC
jgi:hypothetical protein